MSELSRIDLTLSMPMSFDLTSWGRAWILDGGTRAGTGDRLDLTKPHARYFAPISRSLSGRSRRLRPFGQVDRQAAAAALAVAGAESDSEPRLGNPWRPGERIMGAEQLP